MRDAIYAITSNICPIISQIFINDVHIEIPHLIDQAPLMRPGDIVIKHPISTATSPHSLTIIDITIIPPTTSNTTYISYLDSKKELIAHHNKFEYNKFRLKDSKYSYITANQIAQEMTQKRYRLLPFTIDHLCMIGPKADDFLYANNVPDNQLTHADYINPQTSAHITHPIQTSLRKTSQTNILNCATRNWKLSFGDKWYTNTYHAQN